MQIHGPDLLAGGELTTCTRRCQDVGIPSGGQHEVISLRATYVQRQIAHNAAEPGQEILNAKQVLFISEGNQPAQPGLGEDLSNRRIAMPKVTSSACRPAPLQSAYGRDQVSLIKRGRSCIQSSLLTPPG
jgi:hypothetical protein